MARGSSLHWHEINVWTLILAQKLVEDTQLMTVIQYLIPSDLRPFSYTWFKHTALPLTSNVFMLQNLQNIYHMDKRANFIKLIPIILFQVLRKLQVPFITEKHAFILRIKWATQKKSQANIWKQLIILTVTFSKDWHLIFIWHYSENKCLNATRVDWTQLHEHNLTYTVIYCSCQTIHLAALKQENQERLMAKNLPVKGLSPHGNLCVCVWVCVCEWGGCKWKTLSLILCLDDELNNNSGRTITAPAIRQEDVNMIGWMKKVVLKVEKFSTGFVQDSLQKRQRTQEKRCWPQVRKHCCRLSRHWGQL